ncbi:serine dehydratase, partial [Bacillus thuringiensis]|nr:serine dehydratase [Bacillus thuringiensis]
NFHSLEDKTKYLYAFALDSILPGNAQKELGDLSNIANLIIL